MTLQQCPKCQTYHPPEGECPQFCGVPKGDGSICGAYAETYDPLQGCKVCREHAPLQQNIGGPEAPAPPAAAADDKCRCCGGEADHIEKAPECWTRRAVYAVEQLADVLAGRPTRGPERPPLHHDQVVSEAVNSLVAMAYAVARSRDIDDAPQTVINAWRRVQEAMREYNRIARQQGWIDAAL